MLGDELREIEELVARRQNTVKTLRELAFERECDKLPADDYERLRRRYELEAVKIMRRLDEIHGGRGWEGAIDAELERRLHLSSSAPASPPSPTETSPRTVAQPDGDAAALVDCPSCTKAMEADDRFCSGCGQRLDGDFEADDGEITPLSPAAAPAIAADTPSPLPRGENAR